MAYESPKHEGKTSKPPIGHHHCACKVCGYTVLYKDAILKMWVNLKKLSCPNCLNKNMSMFHILNHGETIPESVSVTQQGTNYKPITMNEQQKMQKIFRG